MPDFAWSSYPRISLHTSPQTTELDSPASRRERTWHFARFHGFSVNQPGEGMLKFVVGRMIT